MTLSGFGQDIALPEGIAERLAQHADKEVVMGLRPEHIALGRQQLDNAIHFEAEVVLTEQLGAQQVAEIRVDGHPFMASGIDPDRQLRGGECTEFTVAMDRLHLFEAGETGQVIWSAGVADMAPSQVS